jgi:hypothetical protein
MRHARFAATVFLAGVVLAAARDASAAVALAPSSGSAFPTQSVAVIATITRGGLPLSIGTWTLGFSGLPAGVTTAPAAPSYTIGAAAVFTSATVSFQFVVSAAAAAGGPFPITVSDPGTSTSATFSLTIQEPRISLGIVGGGIILGGGTVPVTVRAVADPGFGLNAKSVPVAFGVDLVPPAPGSPANVTAGGPQLLSAPYSSTFTFPFRKTGPVVPGVYTVPVVATWRGTTGATLTASANLSVSIPDVSISFAGSASVCQGGPAQVLQATFTPLYGFQGTVSVQVLSTPPGTAVSPPTLGALPPPQTGDFQISASGAVLGPATATARIFDRAGAVDKTFSVPFTVVDNVVTPAASPSVLSLQAGGTPQSFTVSAAPPPAICASRASVDVAVVGLPPGITAPASTPLLAPAYGPAAIPLTAAASVPSGSYPVTLRFTMSTGSVRDVPATVAVTGGPGILLQVLPASLTIAAGASDGTNVTVQPLNGFTGTASVVAPTLPGITLSPDRFTVDAGVPTRVAVSVAPGTLPGTYTGNFTATAPGIPGSRTAGLSVTVISVLDFSLSAAPAALTLAPGASAPVTVSAAAGPGFAGTITVVPQLAGGLTVDVASFTLQAGQSRVVTLAAPAGAALGTNSVTFSGTAPGVTGARTATVAVTVATLPDFTLDVQPSTLNLPAGGSAPATVTLVPINGWTSPVDVTVTGSTGVSVVPPSFTLVPGTPKPVEIRADASTPAGAVTLTFLARGTSGTGGVTVTRTVNVQVSVAPYSDFNVRVTPPQARVNAGRRTDLTLVLEPLGAFAGSAAVTVVDAPPGSTFSPPAPVLAPNAPRTMTLSVPRSTPPGAYVVVLRADEVASPSSLARRPLAISKVIRVPLDVQPAVGGFTVTANPVSVQASPGQPIAVNYVFRNLGGEPLRIVGDTFTRSSVGGTVFDSVEETVSLVLPANGTLAYSNAVLATGDMFAKSGQPPVVRADRTFRAEPDATGYVDSATAPVTIAAVNPLLATGSATRISVVFPIAGSLVARGENLRAQGLIFTTGSGLFLVGWYWDGVLVETATVPVQNGTPVAVTNAVTLPTLVEGTHEITLAVLSPNPIASPPVQIYVEDVGSSLRTVSPAGGSAFVPALQPPTFSWVPVPGVTAYKVGLARRGRPEELRWYESDGTRWSPPAAVWNRLPEGEYEWTVRGYSGTGRARLDQLSGGASAPPTSEGSAAVADGWTVSSAPARFSLGGFDARLVPLKGEARPGPAGVTFSWTPVERAVYLLYAFERTGAETRRLFVEMTTNPSLVVEPHRLSGGGPVVWKVVAVDAEGRPLAATPLLEAGAGGAR